MNYFIVVRNDIDNPYDKDSLKETKAELWGVSDRDKDEPRKYSEVYEQIQKDDLLLCYSGKDKGFCAILEAGDKMSEGIILKFKDSLDVPLDVIKEERDYQQI